MKTQPFEINEIVRCLYNNPPIVQTGDDVQVISIQACADCASGWTVSTTDKRPQRRVLKKPSIALHNLDARWFQKLYRRIYGKCPICSKKGYYIRPCGFEMNNNIYTCKYCGFQHSDTFPPLMNNLPCHNVR